jgi:uncharacterized protein with HEPN domain
MTKGRVQPYITQIQQAASDILEFTSGMSEPAFLADRRTQQAVVLNILVIGETSAKLMLADPAFVQMHQKFRGKACVACAIALHTDIST